MDNLFLPLWLKIGLTVFVLLVAIWQVPKIRVRLSGNYSEKQTDPKESASFKHWGKLIIGLVLFVVIGSLGDALLWTQKTYEMAGSKYTFEGDKTDKEHVQALPTSYIFKKPLWQLGFAPLPILVNIPSGEFEMGSDKGEADERPIHKVNIPTPFFGQTRGHF